MIHDAVLWLVLAVIWIVPASLVARLAGRRGYPFFAFLITALIIPWPVMLIVVVALRRKS